MLDLAATGAQLLGELEARGAPEATLLDPADPRLPSAERARVRLEGRSRDALFPLLDALLSARFARVPRERRLRDLLIPARHLLGNAYEQGRGRDRGEAIRVELHATPRGALLRVSDEGPGFDVASALPSGPRSFLAALHASGSAGAPTDACAAARRSPIHGSFGFERVHYGADGRFYVDGFEAFRSGDPSEDADAFLADLAERAPARFGSERRRAASAAFRAAHLAPGVSPARLSSPARTEEDRSR